MAYIIGIAAGTHVSESAAGMVKARRARQKKERAYVKPVAKEYQTDCDACLCPAPAGAGKRPNITDGLCNHCRVIFGAGAGPFGYFRGCTDETPERTLQKIADVKRDGYLMVLRDRSLATPDGNVVAIEAGDIFVCRPSNPEPERLQLATKENSWALFTLRLKLGPYETVLFVHEFTSISLQKVMMLRQAGEIVETFMSTDDENGHFAPTPALREQIVELFGRLIV